MSPRPEHAVVVVRVTPRSSQNRIEAQADETLKVWVTAPPVEGEANKAVCEAVAKRLRIAKSRVSVLSGDGSRDKRISIEGISLGEVLAQLKGKA